MKISEMKRLFGLVLSLVLLVGCLGVMTPAAELKAEDSVTYEKVSSAGTLTGNGTLNNVTGSRFYASFAIKLQEITQIAEVWKNNQYAWGEDGWDVDVLINGEKSVADVDYNSAGELSFFIYHKDELLQGATVKVRKGQYKPKGTNVTCGLEFTQNYSYIWTGEKLVLVHAVPFKETQSGGWNHTNGYAWNFELTESIAAFAAIDNFWDYNCWELPVYINGVQKSVEMRYANSKFDMMGTGLDSEPSDGTTITIPAGAYLSVDKNYAIAIEKDYTFVWDGSKWVTPNVVSFKVENGGTWWQYSRETPNGQANKLYPSEPISNFTDSNFWYNNLWKINVKIGDTTQQLRARYSEESSGFDFVFDSIPTDDTLITVLAGAYVSEGENKVILIDKDYTFRKNGNYFRQDYYKIDEYRASSETGNSCPQKEGYVFAGWYHEAAYSTAIAAEVTEGYAFAKFVPEEVVGVHFQKKANGIDKTEVRIVTTVDSLLYENVGFELVKTVDETQYKKVITSNTVYRTVKGGGETYTPASAGGEKAQYFMTAVFTLPNNETTTILKVTTFWTTLDGTKVYGQTRMITTGELVAVAAGGN